MKKSKVIFGIYLLGISIILFVIAYKRPFTNEVISANGAAYEQHVDSVAFGYRLEQSFQPQNEGLSAIDIYVNTQECSTTQGKLQVSIVDGNDTMCFIKDIPLSELPEYGWYRVELATPITAFSDYTLILESIDCTDLGPKISFFAANQAAAAEQTSDTLIYAGQEVTNAALRIRFIYHVPIAWYMYGVYIVFAVMIGLWLRSFEKH